MPKFLATLITLPALALSTVAADASDLCARLEARLNQMPEIIGAGEAADMKAESIYRLNLLERAVRQDLRRMKCPTNSIIAFGAENAKACSRLSEELASVRDRRQSFEELEPVVSQHVDDGSGLLPAILREMRRAGCDRNEGIEGNVEIITQRSEDFQPEQTSYSTGMLQDDQMQQSEQDMSAADPLAEQDGEQTAALLGDGNEADYGAPENYGMIEVSPGEMRGGQSVTSVELPKLEDTSKVPAPGAQPPKTAAITPPPPVATIPDRDYDPTDKRVRRVGPTFLADDDHIDLKHPADRTAN